MLTAEIRINGILIVHVYVVNIERLATGQSLYRYEIYEIGEGKRPRLRKGEIIHGPGDGAKVLVRKILAQATGK